VASRSEPLRKQNFRTVAPIAVWHGEGELSSESGAPSALGGIRVRRRPQRVIGLDERIKARTVGINGRRRVRSLRPFRRVKQSELSDGRQNN
jgi:hypothetical protein